MSHRVLITGGAGFIGSHLVDRMLALGWEVRVLDSLVARVHGELGQPPAYLDGAAELIRADLRDAAAVRRALRRVDAVVHLAALVGVGQSMYELASHTAVNKVGTAVLLEELIRNPVQRLVVASSMSVYGEGLYRSEDGRPVGDARRDPERLARRCWEPVERDGESLRPVATPEGARGGRVGAVGAVVRSAAEGGAGPDRVEREMRAAVLVAPRRSELRAVPVPAAGPRQLLIRIEGCGVCGSSAAVWEGRPWFRYPLPAGAPGHEGWGEAPTSPGSIGGPRAAAAA